MNRTDVLDDALDRLSHYAFLDGPGLACHGPMGAEALSGLGHDDLVAAWADRYVATHPAVAAPPPVEPVDLADDASWRPALGDFSRASDWAAAFRAALAEAPLDDVLARWVPRLITGYGGGLTHGLLRTAHAVRALPDDAQPSSLMLTELCNGLASWAAWYRPLPGHPHLRGELGLEDAAARIPRPTVPWSPMDAATLARVHELPGFADVVEAHGPVDHPGQQLSDLTAFFCRLLLSLPHMPVPFVHLVTPIVAARTLIERVPELDPRTVYARTWQVGAGLLAGGPPLPPIAPAAAFVAADQRIDAAALAAMAAEHGDPHVIKFAEACLREYRHAADPVYLVAAHTLTSTTAR